jgi:3-deoxy-D-manno-octulosonic-acid transferase
VITGPHTYNFESIVETFVKAGAIVELQPMSDSATIVELANVVLDLLADPAQRSELGRLAQSLVDENRGATERTLQLLNPILSKPANIIGAVDSSGAKSAPVA